MHSTPNDLMYQFSLALKAEMEPNRSLRIGLARKGEAKTIIRLCVQGVFHPVIIHCPMSQGCAGLIVAQASLKMHKHIHTHMHTNMHTHTCMHTLIHMHPHMHTHIHMHPQMHTHIHMHPHMQHLYTCTHMYTFICTCTHSCAHIYTCAHTSTHIYTCTQTDPTRPDPPNIDG